MGASLIPFRSFPHPSGHWPDLCFRVHPPSRLPFCPVAPAEGQEFFKGPLTSCFPSAISSLKPFVFFFANGRSFLLAVRSFRKTRAEVCSPPLFFSQATYSLDNLYRFRFQISPLEPLSHLIVCCVQTHSSPFFPLGASLPPAFYRGTLIGRLASAVPVLLARLF